MRLSKVYLPAELLECVSAGKVKTPHLLGWVPIDVLKFHNLIICPGGGEWIISLGDYVDNSFTALGSSDPREVRLEL